MEALDDMFIEGITGGGCGGILAIGRERRGGSRLGKCQKLDRRIAIPIDSIQADRDSI